MERKAPVPCPVTWPAERSANEHAAGSPVVTHECALPATHLQWPSALHPGPIDHTCDCGITLPVRDVDEDGPMAPATDGGFEMHGDVVL